MHSTRRVATNDTAVDYVAWAELGVALSSTKRLFPHRLMTNQQRDGLSPFTSALIVVGSPMYGRFDAGMWHQVDVHTGRRLAYSRSVLIP